MTPPDPLAPIHLYDRLGKPVPPTLRELGAMRPGAWGVLIQGPRHACEFPNLQNIPKQRCPSCQNDVAGPCGEGCGLVVQDMTEVDGVLYRKAPVPDERPNPCAGCSAEYDLKLCSKLPYCGDSLGDKEVIFIRVSPS